MKTRSKGGGKRLHKYFLENDGPLTLILLLSPSGARSDWDCRTLNRQRVGSMLSSQKAIHQDKP